MHNDSDCETPLNILINISSILDVIRIMNPKIIPGTLSICWGCRIELGVINFCKYKDKSNLL